MKIEKVRWDSLSQHPKNPRNGDVDAIKESIKANGVYRPIICSRDNVILAGHHLWMALGDLGYGDVDIVRVDVDGNTDAATRILLADNKTADLGIYDDGLLSELLDSLDDLVGTGYSLGDLPPIDEPETDKDIVTDAPARVERGQVWTLGEHTLICDDASNVSLDSYDVVIADLPDMNLVRTILEGITVNESFVFTSMSDIDSLIQANYCDELLVWVKDRPTGKATFPQTHELIAFAGVKQKQLTSVFTHSLPTDLSRFPDQKPVALYQELFVGSHGTVLDPFAGLGTTLVAALFSRLTATLIEKDPRRCDIIINRFETITQEKATL